jgi:hypothetical protein
MIVYYKQSNAENIAEVTMKRLFVIIVIIAAIILLFPIRGQMKDGGSVQYCAALYCVTNMHRIHVDQNEDGTFIDGYVVGIVIEILGIEVFNNTRFEAAE